MAIHWNYLGNFNIILNPGFYPDTFYLIGLVCSPVIGNFKTFPNDFNHWTWYRTLSDHVDIKWSCSILKLETGAKNVDLWVVQVYSSGSTWTIYLNWFHWRCKNKDGLSMHFRCCQWLIRKIASSHIKGQSFQRQTLFFSIHIQLHTKVLYDVNIACKEF